MFRVGPIAVFLMESVEQTTQHKTKGETMKNAALFTIVAGLVFSSASVADAQIYTLPTSSAQVQISGPWWTWNNWYGNYPYYINTDPGNLRGQAQLIESQGLYRESISQARRNSAEARKAEAEAKQKELENRQLRIEQRRLQKQQYEQRQVARNAKRRAIRDRVLQRRRVEAQARQAAIQPKQQQTWPSALLRSEFATRRAELNVLLTQQQNGEVAGVSSQISAKAKELKAELKKNIRNLSANEYLAAKRFLDELI